MCLSALLIHAVHIRLLLAIRHCLISAAPYSVAGYMPAGSTDPEPQFLHIPFLEIVCHLQKHWHGDNMVMVDQSSDYCRLITTKSVCHSSLGNPSTIISTAQRRSSRRVKRRIIKMYAIDQTVFGFCFIYAPFPTTWQFPIFPSSNKSGKWLIFLKFLITKSPRRDIGLFGCSSQCVTHKRVHQNS